MEDDFYSDYFYEDTFTTGDELGNELAGDTRTLSEAELAAVGGIMMFVTVVALVFAVVTIVALWKVFTKAKQPGWAAVVPLYNAYILLKMIGRPVWFLVLFFVPVVNLIVALIMSIDLAKVFGKSPLFGVFLNFLLAPIGWLIIAFDKSEYKGPVAS